jgi:hypothetical protein
MKTFKETVSALLHMRWLEPGWDSYGAKEIDHGCISKAIESACQLSGSWHPVPLADGGVQLEQHADGLDIEITIRRAPDEATGAL